MARLLASSGSVEGIQKLVNEFWYNDQFTVDATTLEIRHPDRSVSPMFRVVLRGRCYRFEHAPEAAIGEEEQSCQ
jgi:hypothetical protein